MAYRSERSGLLMLDSKEIGQRLSWNTEAVCEMLLTGWKREGKRLVIGSIHGEKGKSLKVELSGAKRGRWADYGGDDRGDLLDLWATTKNISLGDARKQALEYLGVDIAPLNQQRKKTYQRPVRPACAKPKSAVLDYLLNTRKLTQETIEAFKVGEDGRLAVFPYLVGGELIMWKKDPIIDRQQDGRRQKSPWASEATEWILFGWQAIEKHFPQSRRVFICEGELDALTMFQYGYPALSVPFGGGGGEKQKWIEGEFDRLLQFDEIFLCLDGDKTGQEGTTEIIKRLGEIRCRIVTLPRKDANECLQAGITREEIETCIRNAKHVGPEELKNAGDLREDVEKYLTQLESGDHIITLPWVKTHQELRLEMAQLTVWSAFNGHGKSEMLLNLMAYRMSKDEKVCIASMEVPYQKLIARHLLQQITAVEMPSAPYRHKVYDWFSDRLWLFTLVGTAKADRLIEVFRYAWQKHGIHHFVVDSLLKVGLAEDDHNGVKAFVEKLCDFKNQTGAHVHLVCHSKKKDEGEYVAPRKQDVRGTAAITDLADNVLCIHRNKQKEDLLKGDPGLDEERKVKDKTYTIREIQRWPDTYLNCYKQKEAGIEPQFPLWFDPATKQYLERQNDGLRRYVQYSGEPVVVMDTGQNAPINWDETWEVEF